jgi:hypothetical protein
MKGDFKMDNIITISIKENQLQGLMNKLSEDLEAYKKQHNEETDYSIREYLKKINNNVFVLINDIQDQANIFTKNGMDDIRKNVISN